MTWLSACSGAIFGLNQPMASINQNRYPNLLPNFRNLGVMLRLIVIVIGMTIFGAALKSANWFDMYDQWLSISALVAADGHSLAAAARTGQWLAA